MSAEIVRCPACGQANRVPALAGGKQAVCGKCRTPLTTGAATENPVTLTDANFGATIAHGKFVVDFWAAWCGPCRTMAPVIDDLAHERTDVRFGKLNVDENQRTGGAFNVRGIPMLVFFRNGTESGRVVGAVPKAQIEQAIARYLGD